MPPRNAVLVISEAIGLVEASPASREHKLKIAVFLKFLTMKEYVLTIYLVMEKILLIYQRQESNLFVCLVVLNATFNNISVISGRSVLLVEDPKIDPSLTNFIT
jgi:hypothetical protein